jgi:hypothetical protein
MNETTHGIRSESFLLLFSLYWTNASPMQNSATRDCEAGYL